jgi:hypothetical protein
MRPLGWDAVLFFEFNKQILPRKTRATSNFMVLLTSLHTSLDLEHLMFTMLKRAIT